MNHPLEEFVKTTYLFSAVDETAFGWGDGVRAGNGDGNGNGGGYGWGSPTGCGESEGDWTEENFKAECARRGLP